MSDDLDRQIEQKLEAAEQKRSVYRTHLAERMSARVFEEDRRSQIAAHATHIFGSVMRPRIALLVAKFPNATLIEDDS